MSLYALAHYLVKPLAFYLGYVPVTEAVGLLDQQQEGLVAAADCLNEIKRIIESVDTLRGVNIDGYEMDALRNIVSDHEELESRIEAVLLMIANAEERLDPQEVGRVLCGGTRIPDTVEGL